MLKLLGEDSWIVLHKNVITRHKISYTIVIFSHVCTISKLWGKKTQLQGKVIPNNRISNKSKCNQRKKKKPDYSNW